MANVINRIQLRSLVLRCVWITLILICMAVSIKASEQSYIRTTTLRPNAVSYQFGQDDSAMDDSVAFGFELPQGDDVW